MNATYFQLQNDKQLIQYLLFLNQELKKFWRFYWYSNYGTGAGILDSSFYLTCMQVIRCVWGRQ